MKGFFASNEITKKPVSTLPACGACGYYKHCNSPKVAVKGKGRQGVLIVGEFPTKDEDEEGRPYRNSSWRFMRDLLLDFDIDMMTDCWVMNSIACLPALKLHGDKRTTIKKANVSLGDAAIHCRPNVVNAIKLLKPKVVILLGQYAVTSVVSWLWGEAAGSIARWAGFQIPSQEINAWVCPTYAPYHALHAKNDTEKDIMARVIRQHVSNAMAKRQRPWETVPDYRSQVEILFDTDRASRVIEQMNSRGGLIAFDYECNMLKPDSDEARIVSCSVCWEGKKTIAFPWKGGAVKSMRRLLLSDTTAKVASNMKFEDRWTRAAFGSGVSNWRICTMIASHVLDCRQEITSIKFQAFARLGFGLWNSAVDKFLKTNHPEAKPRGANTPNQIEKADMRDLLLYNGLDSLLELLVARQQFEEGLD